MQLTASDPQYAYAPTMMPMMAGGGLAEAARALQSRGRGEDTMLVHMTPGEVKGLQALAMAHGGSLTINPSTGLPEAGFLKNLLPTIAGIGLNFLFPGSGALIGMGVGAFETMRTGDLGKGLLAGLGAYGGANIGQALTSMGAEAAATSALPVGGSTATGVSPLATAGGESLLGQTAQMSTVPGSSLLEAAGSTGAPMSQSAVTALQDTARSGFAQQGMFDQLGQGAQAAFSDPKTFGSTLYNQMGTTGSIAAATPTLMSVSEALTPKMEFAQAPTEKSSYEGPYYPTERSVRFKPQDDLSTSEFSFFTPSNPVPGYQPYRFAAQGGLMDLARGGAADNGEDPRAEFAEGGKLEERGPIQMPGADYVAGTDPEFNHGFKPVQVQGAPDPNMGDAIVGKLFGNVPSSIGGKGVLSKLLKQVGGDIQSQLNPKDLENYKYDPQTQQLVKKASGGLTALAGGRFLQGPGDGTSDSIPAVIANKQPARLADGEFVVDARTVSELGNGSSKAGAKKLYAMMDRVHNARKKAGRGMDSKAERFMPA